jgi:FOG: TPR repeat, SEL1 subfamily
VPKNFTKAAELFEKAANQGDATGQCDLGVLYRNGQGVPKDLGKAAELFGKAADQGYARAQNHLGWLYQNGQDVLKDPGNTEFGWQNTGIRRIGAVELFEESADQDLGRLFETGQRVSKDLTKAAELYQKAADQGYALAQNNLGWLYENGWGVSKDLSKAAELYKKAADQGNQHAIANLKRLSGQ